MAVTSPYSVHPSVPYAQKIIASLKTKTGRSIDEWIAFVKKSGPKTEIERRAWLKDAHSLGTNYAWWIADREFRPLNRRTSLTPSIAARRR